MNKYLMVKFTNPVLIIYCIENETDITKWKLEMIILAVLNLYFVSSKPNRGNICLFGSTNRSNIYLLYYPTRLDHIPKDENYVLNKPLSSLGKLTEMMQLVNCMYIY